jgi:hypothetical protein
MGQACCINEGLRHGRCFLSVFFFGEDDVALRCLLLATRFLLAPLLEGLHFGT